MIETPTEDTEEWVAHPDKHKHVAAHKHADYASRPGWWCLVNRPEKPSRQKPDELADDQ